MNPVVIVGAGISGLAAAFFLKKAGIPILLLEADSTVGGTMKSRIINGFLVETGPNSALETSELFDEILVEIGLNHAKRYANSASKKRFIMRRRKLYELPLNPIKLISTRLWKLNGKLRILLEPFHGRYKGEESVSSFVKRRLGKEFLDYAINPFVAGVFAGNPDRLSVQEAFPKLYALEEKYGGIFMGVLRGSRVRKQRRKNDQGKNRARMLSFTDGMGQFATGIAQFLGDCVKTGYRIHSITKHERQYDISIDSVEGNKTLTSSHIILSIPAYSMLKMDGFSVNIFEKLNQIYYPPVAEVSLGYKKDHIQASLDGFGFLVPEKEKRSILGCIYSSTLFENRAPEGHANLTCFIGGARQPDLARLPDESLIDLAQREVADILNINEKPVFTHVSKWEKAIPQYELGYKYYLESLQHFESENSGIYFCANYRGGISVGDCLKSAKACAERVLNDLQKI